MEWQVRRPAMEAMNICSIPTPIALSLIAIAKIGVDILQWSPYENYFRGFKM